MQPRTVRWLLAVGLLGAAYLFSIFTIVGVIHFEFMRHPSDYESFLKYLGFSISGAFLVLAGLLAWKAILRPAYIAVFAMSIVFRILLVSYTDPSDLFGNFTLGIVPLLIVFDLLGIYIFGFNKGVRSLFEVKQ